MEEQDYYSGSSGLDPQTKRYFKKIVSSFFTGIFWMLLMSTFGFFLGWALVYEEITWHNMVFYPVFLLSLLWIIRYYYRLWKD